MFRIITLEREFGCGCGRIGSELATSLGWKLWDQNLTCEIARRANVDESEVASCEERVDGRLYRFAKAFWRGSYERSMPLASFKATELVKPFAPFIALPAVGTTKTAAITAWA